MVSSNWRGRALTRSSSFHAAPVTGSLLFYAPVCCPTVCCATGFSSWVLFGGSDCIWLAVFGLFFRRVTPVEAEILVIGPSDRVGGSRGRSGWLLLVSQGAWLWFHQIGVRGAAVSR